MISEVDPTKSCVFLVLKVELKSSREDKKSCIQHAFTSCYIQKNKVYLKRKDFFIFTTRLTHQLVLTLISWRFCGWQSGLTAGGFLFRILCMFSLCMRGFLSWCSSFLPPSKNIHFRVIDDSKWERTWACGYLSPCGPVMDWIGLD